MAVNDGICACCGYVGEDIEEHHLYLKTDGCPDDLTVFLCGPCHGRVHQIPGRMNIRIAISEGHKRAKLERGTTPGIDLPKNLIKVVRQLAAVRKDGSYLSYRKLSKALFDIGYKGHNGKGYAPTSIRRLVTEDQRKTRVANFKAIETYEEFRS